MTAIDALKEEIELILIIGKYSTTTYSAMYILNVIQDSDVQKVRDFITWLREKDIGASRNEDIFTYTKLLELRTR